MNLKLKALVAVLTLPLVFGAILFSCAETLHYWQGWAFLSIFFTASLANTLYLMKNDPDLLARRMRGGPTAEKRQYQRVIMLCVTVLFVALFVVAGIDYKLALSHLPTAIVVLADFMVALSFYVYHLVFKENSFASATIEISEGQKVISTGPYSIVRHPMYASGLIFLLSMPFALGSLWALLILLPLIPFLIWRLLDEEQFLSSNLKGYNDYCCKVKYRLVPWLF